MGIHIMPPFYKMVITPPPEEVIVGIYPDAHPESKSVDGSVGQMYASPEEDETWANIIAAAGVDSSDATTTLEAVSITPSSVANKWHALTRAIILFDTSELPDGCVIVEAVLSVYGFRKDDYLSIAPDVNVYSSDPLSNVLLVPGDFDCLGSIPFCDTPISYTNWSLAGYNNFILNAAGREAISKTGVTKLGLRNANYDVAGSTPAWSDNPYSILFAYSADKGGDFRPKLTITYRV